MKTMQSDLLQYLTTEKNFISCDLFEIELANGYVLYLCDHDEDITYNGHTYLHDACIVNRTSTEIRNNLSVDKMTLTLYVDRKDKIENAPILHAATSGGLDSAKCKCMKVFFDDKFRIKGTIELFSGILEIRKGGGMEIVADVKSKIQMLNVNWPNRRYYPTCAYSLYSHGCGVNKKDFSFTGTVTGVRSSSSFDVSVNKDDGFFENGAIQFLSGQLVGKDSTIRTNKGQSITLLVSQEVAPSVGDTVKLYAGCDKTYAQCKNKFNNGSHNRSTPYIPLKESTI